MDYNHHYTRLIERAKTRTPDPAIHYEKHHIIPRCLNGTNDKSNLVKLTPEEHYVAHQLLVKIFPGNRGLVHAATMLCVDGSGHRSNNKIYGWLRKLDAETKSKSQRGRKLGPNKKKGRPGHPSTLKGTKRGHPWNYGLKTGPNGKAGISTGPNKKKGRPGAASARKGKKYGHNAKLGKPDGPQEKIICPYCGKEGGKGGMKRYHFVNCEFYKPIDITTV